MRVIFLGVNEVADFGLRERFVRVGTFRTTLVDRGQGVQGKAPLGTILRRSYLEREKRP